MHLLLARSRAGFEGAGDGHGRYNQFVPQLMLGSTLCNSSNAPLYTPDWCQLKTWHIGAQYFMGLYGCNNQSDAASCGFTPKAATGDLIAVSPGDKVYTRFDRVQNNAGAKSNNADYAPATAPNPEASPWRLTMGIVGDPVPPSIVIADKPYMGLIPSAQSWASPAFSTAYPGSCWELYGTTQPSDYPPYM